MSEGKTRQAGIRQARPREGRADCAKGDGNAASEDVGQPVVACEWIENEEGPASEGFQADAAAAMTSSTECEKLVFWTNVVADWADRMPLRNVFIFGDHARGDAAPASKLKIAIEYDGNVSDDMMRRWQQENSTDFAELKRALGIETELYVDQDYDVWPPIRDAARAPVMTVRKVRVVRTTAL